MTTAVIDQAKEHLGKVLEEQLTRIDRMKRGEEETDYSQLEPIIVGIIGGDGIGPFIADEARRVLEIMMKDELESGIVEFRNIEVMMLFQLHK